MNKWFNTRTGLFRGPRTSDVKSPVFDILALILLLFFNSQTCARCCFEFTAISVRYITRRSQNGTFSTECTATPIRSTDELGGDIQTVYTVNDDIQQVVAPNGSTTTYKHDDYGNRTEESSPDRGTTHYSYEVWGAIKKQVDARGQETGYFYDNLKRLRTIGYGTTDNVDFTYDDCTGGKGRICTVDDKSGVTQYEYDAFGNVTRLERNIDGVLYNTAYTYDAQNQVDTVTYQSGRKLTYVRDSLGRVEQVTQTVNGANTALLSGRSYRGDNQWSSQVLGNGLTETRSYDLQGRLNELNLAEGGTTVYFRHFDYDANGNVTARKIDASLSNAEFDASFGYDVLDRLTTEDHGSHWTSPVPGQPVRYPTTFSYTDPDGSGPRVNNGNRRSRTRDGSTTGYVYTNNSNRLESRGGQSISYDAAGNMTGRGIESWVYGPRGLVRQYGRDGSTVASYTYDYRNLRSKKALAGASTVVYLYDLEGQLIGEYENGQRKREYVWVDGAPLVQIDNGGSGDTVTWFTTDHLLTPRLGTDSDKVPVWEWNSYAFGETSPHLPEGSTGAMPRVNLRFPGQYFDDESGLHYNWNRYYSSVMGRYITSDPIGLEGGLNTFAFVSSNPLSNVDVLGLDYKPQGTLGHGDLVVNSGATVSGWIADVMKNGSSASICGCDPSTIPSDADVDMFFVNGEWLKIFHGSVVVDPPQQGSIMCPINGDFMTIFFPVTEPGVTGFISGRMSGKDKHAPEDYINDQERFNDVSCGCELPGRPVPRH